MGRKRQALSETVGPFERAFAERLIELMGKAGHDAESLGVAIGKSRGAVYSWCSATYAPPLECWPAIAKALRLKKVRDLVPVEFDPPEEKA
ncbi:MAG TPA: helix-turn-helix transcriptional regulator [Pirellulales bacterium]